MGVGTFVQNAEENNVDNEFDIRVQLRKLLTTDPFEDVDPFFLHPEYSGLFVGGMQIPYKRVHAIYSNQGIHPRRKGVFVGDDFKEVKPTDDDDSLF